MKVIMEKKYTRAPNFTQLERQCIFSSVLKYKNILESKETNKVFVEKKNKTWDIVCAEFNSKNTSKRTLDEIKRCYFNSKKRSKKALSNNKVEGGPCSNNVETPPMKLRNSLPEIYPEENPYDCDLANMGNQDEIPALEDVSSNPHLEEATNTQKRKCEQPSYYLNYTDEIIEVHEMKEEASTDGEAIEQCPTTPPRTKKRKIKDIHAEVTNTTQTILASRKSAEDAERLLFKKKMEVLEIEAEKRRVEIELLRNRAQWEEEQYIAGRESRESEMNFRARKAQMEEEKHSAEMESRESEIKYKIRKAQMEEEQQRAEMKSRESESKARTRRQQMEEEKHISEMELRDYEMKCMARRTQMDEEKHTAEMMLLAQKQKHWNREELKLKRE